MSTASHRAFADPDDEDAWFHCHDKASDRCLDRASVPWLFHERLPRSGVALLVGASGVGKTFLAIDLARAVASGGEFFGVKASHSAGAVILAAEDWLGVRTRLLALENEDLPIRATHVENLRSEEAQERATRRLNEAFEAFRQRRLCSVGLGVIVIDTLAASGLLPNENDNADCTIAMRFAAELAAEYDCLVVVTHHPGKRDVGARGGSALFACADVVLHVRSTKTPGVHALDCAKNRNASAGSWGSFALVPHLLGRDREGHEISTLRVSAAAADCRGGSAEVSEELVKSIVSAIGSRTLRKDPQSPDSAHRLIAECAKLEFTTAAGKRRAKAILSALLATGFLMEGTELIGGRYRPTVFAPRKSS
jgi:hypothetical protein